MEVLKIDNLAKSYGKNIVFSGVNLTVNKGDMLAITGESGKGKTTLLNIMGLITKKDSGNIVIYNKVNPHINSNESMLLRRKNIGYLFQNFGLVDDETVFWNLNLALEYKKISKKERIKKIDDLLKRFDLSYLKTKKIYQLSGGEQQRIAILRLILQDSDLILADEPTASLDCENEKIVMEYLKELNTSGKTIIVVTHNMDILNYFTRVIDISDL